MKDQHLRRMIAAAVVLLCILLLASVFSPIPSLPLGGTEPAAASCTFRLGTGG